jgi:hypothetical protein
MVDTLEPVSVALKFGFVAILYLFLLWVTRSALKDLRSMGGGGPSEPAQATSLHPAASASGNGYAQLVVERAPGHESGLAYDIGDGAVLGRGDEAEIRLEDPFASSNHARLLRQGSVMVIEDMGSTNGTFLNEELLTGPQPLHPGDRIRIGDSEFVFED